MDIDIKTLREIRDREKNSPNLQDVGKDFYKDMDNYLKDIYTEYLKFSKEGKISKLAVLAGELENIKTVINDIYGAREKKIVLNALYHVKSGDELDLEHLTDEENKMLEQMIEILQKQRKKILEPMVSERHSQENKQGKNPKQKVPLITLRMLKEAPSIVGVDGKVYGSFKAEDVVTMPKANGEVFIKQGVAELLKIE